MTPFPPVPLPSWPRLFWPLSPSDLPSSLAVSLLGDFSVYGLAFGLAVGACLVVGASWLLAFLWAWHWSRRA
jgi:hypothetical protein